MDHNRKVVELLLDDVLPNRFQPRIKFNEESIIELSESIKEHGVIQPIVVRPVGDKFEIIAGERRYKAACMAGLEKIPALITDLNDKDSAEVALIENVQRKDLTPIEEAISYKKILDMGYLTQEKLAEKLGKKQSTVANKLRLLNLDEDVQEAILEDKISERHARSILKLSNPEDQRRILKKIIEERLTVRKTDEEINKMLNGTYINDDVVLNSEPLAVDNKKDLVEYTPFDFSKLDFLQSDQSNEIPKFEDVIYSETKKDNLEEILGRESHSFEEKNAFDVPEPITEAPAPFVFDELFLNEITSSDNKESEQVIEKNDEIENLEDYFNNISKGIQEKGILDDEFSAIESAKKEEPVMTGNNTYVASDFKTVINTIKNCAETIEKYGFKVNIQELELPGEYNVTFSIEK